MATEVPEAKVDLVAKEIELTQLLALNDPKTRSDGIKQIKQLLHENSEDTSDAFQLNDYLIIWRGLFNFMWTSDKPVPQESVTEKLSYLIHSCTSYQGKIFFLDAFFLTIKDNWMSIRQHHRTNTCMMWVRHCLRQLLFTFVNCDWNLEYMNKFSEILYRALKSFTPSLKTDLQVIFLEELAKVSRGKVPTEALVTILDSFLHYISELNDFMLIREVTQNVFRNLLSPSPDLEKLTAKFQASQKIVDPVFLKNELESVEGDVANENSNEKNENPLDFQAGNVSVVIPRINFNPKDVTKVLNKYLTEVDCTRKCLWEITKLTKFYNRLGDCVPPNRPKDLKLKSRVLKQKKKKYSSKMVKDGVKKLEMVDSKIKKSGLEVLDHKSLKDLNKMGDIVVDREKIGKSMWKVRHFDNVNTLKENYNLNGSWTVSKETIIDGINTMHINNDKPPIMVHPAFNVEVSVFQEKTPKKIQKKVSLIPNFKYLTFNPSLKEINSNKRKSRSKITKIKDRSKNKKQNSRFIQIGTPNSIKACNKNSLSLSEDHEVSATKKIRNSIKAEKSIQSVNTSPFIKKLFTQVNENEEKNKIEDALTLQAPAGYNVEVPETPENILTKLQKKDSLTPSLTCPSDDSSIRELNKMGEIVVKSGKFGKSIWKVRESNKINTLKENINLNGSWTVSIDTTINGTNTLCINDSKQPLLVPVGFNVEVLGTPEKTLTKLQKKNSLTQSLTCPSVDSSMKEHDKMGEIVVERRKILKPTWKVRNIDNVSTSKENFSLNGSWIVSKETMIECNNTVCINDDKPLILVPPGFNDEVLKSPENTPMKVQNKVLLTPSLTPLTVDSSNEPNEKSIQKSNSLDKICSPNIVNQSHNNSCYLSADNKGSASNKVKESNPSSIVDNGILLTSVITPDKSSKSLKIPIIEKRVLRRKTIFFSKNKPDGQNERIPKSKAKDTSATRVLQKCRKTTAREEISNNALEKVVRKSYKINTLKENFNLNGSWTVSIDTTIDGTNNMCINDTKQPLLVPVGFNVEVLGTPEKTLTKLQNKNSLTQSLTCLSVDSSIKEHNKMGEIVVERRKILKPMWKVRNVDNVSTLKENFSLNGSWIVSKEKCRRRTARAEVSNKALERVRSEAFEDGFGFLRRRPRLSTKTTKELQKCRKTTARKGISNKALERVRSEAFEDGFGFLRRSPRLSTKSTKELQKCRKTTAREEISNKALEKVPSEAFEVGFGFLRRSPRLSTKTTKELQKCRNTTARKVISNKALERVPSEAFEVGFGFLRRSPRLSTKTTKELQKCRNTTARKVISNKALERVRSEAFDYGFGSLRRSPRLSTKTTKELQKCWKTTAREEISMLKPEEISNKALEKVVRKSYKINTLKENMNLNGSWTVSIDTTIDGTNTLCINDSKKPLLVDSSIKEHNKVGEIVVECRKILKPMWKVRNVDNVSTLKENFSLNGSWIVSIETMIECNNTVCINDDKPLILVPPGFNDEVLKSPENTPMKVQNKVLLTPSLTPLTVDSSNEPNEKSIQKSNSLDKICSPNIVKQSHNNSCYLSADNNGSASNKVKESNPSSIVENGISLSSVITPDKSSKSLKIPTIEKRVLRRKTIFFSKNKPDGQNERIPKSKAKETSAIRVLRKCRKTTAREEISNKALEKVLSEAFENGFGFLRRSPRLLTKTTKGLKICRKTTAREEISNKALERVRSEALEDGFVSPRKSLRLSIKTDSAKKIVE